MILSVVFVSDAEPWRELLSGRKEPAARLRVERLEKLTNCYFEGQRALQNRQSGCLSELWENCPADLPGLYQLLVTQCISRGSGCVCKNLLEIIQQQVMGKNSHFCQFDYHCS